MAKYLACSPLTVLVCAEKAAAVADGHKKVADKEDRKEKKAAAIAKAKADK